MTPAETWKALQGRGEIPARAGSCHGPLLILGGGRNVWTEYATVRPWGGEIMVVNDIGTVLHETVAHWVTLHPEYMAGWRLYRLLHNYAGDPLHHSNKMKDGIDIEWHMENVGGSSGLLAVFIGLLLGYDSITLAGVGIDNTGHYFDPPWYGTDLDDGSVREVWRWAKANVFDGRVSSLGGNTKTWLQPNVGIAA